MVFEGGEVCWAEFSLLASFLRFAYSFTTMSLANKWGLPFDSAYQKGVDTTFQDILIVGGDGLGGG
jgi:hypothetical protein